MIPSSTTKRRLTIAKEMYLHGFSHSLKNFLSDNIHAILDFDYCVEIILKTILIDSGISIVQGRDIPRRPKGFHRLISDVKLVYSSIRSFPDLTDLHDLRNSVQHGGIVPSNHEVQRFNTDVRRFFTEICSICYDNNINFNEISLALFVPSIVEQIILERMEEYLQKSQYSDAYSYAREAFNYHKLLLRENMKMPFRRYTNFGYDWDGPLDEIINWAEDTQKVVDWLVDRISARAQAVCGVGSPRLMVIV